MRIIYWGRLFSGTRHLARAGWSFADSQRRTLQSASRINSFGQLAGSDAILLFRPHSLLSFSLRFRCGRIIQIYRTPNAILSRHPRAVQNPFCFNATEILPAGWSNKFNSEFRVKVSVYTVYPYIFIYYLICVCMCTTVLCIGNLLRGVTRDEYTIVLLSHGRVACGELL